MLLFKDCNTFYTSGQIFSAFCCPGNAFVSFLALNSWALRISYIRWNLGKVLFHYSRSRTAPHGRFSELLLTPSSERDQWKPQVLREAKNLVLAIGFSCWAKAEASLFRLCCWKFACMYRNLSLSMSLSVCDPPTGLQSLIRVIFIYNYGQDKKPKVAFLSVWLFL